MESPYRSEVPKEQTWDLTRVFKTEADWEAAFKAGNQGPAGLGRRLYGERGRPL